MKKLFLLATITSCFVLSSVYSQKLLAQDEPQECINSNDKQNYLVKQYNEAMKTSPISAAIFKGFPQNPKEKTEADSLLAKPCSACLAAQLKYPTNDLDSFKKFLQSGSRISTECIRAARHFSASTPEIQCPEDKEIASPAVFTTQGKKKVLEQASGACINLSMLDYQGLVLENMYRCIRKYSSAPFGPSTFFETMARESTFRPNYSHKFVGHGGGQLTKPFVEDVQLPNRGKQTLDAIALDASPECAAASMIAKEDIARITPPQGEDAKSFKPNPYVLGRDRCLFMQYGSGMERNALWMMVGLDTLWRRNLNSKPEVTAYLKKYKNHPDVSKVMEKMMQMAYGRTGQGGMYTVFLRLSALPPDRFLKELVKPMKTSEGDDDSIFNNLTAYPREIANRQRDITKYIDDPELKAKFAKEGASACVQ